MMSIFPFFFNDTSGNLEGYTGEIEELKIVIDEEEITVKEDSELIKVDLDESEEILIKER